MTTTEVRAENVRAWRAFAVASASIFMFVLDAGFLSVALPEIERTFPDSTRATITWVSTGYLVAVAGLMLVAGRLGDVYGRRRIFHSGLAVLGAGAVLTGVSPVIGLVIAARMIQGIGGALVTANSLTLVLSDLPESRRPLAIGLWGTAGSIAAVLGPTVGAQLLDATSWRVVVSVIGPLSLITYLAGRPVLREAVDHDAPRHIDPIAVVLVTAGIGGLALALSQSGVWGWLNVKTIIALVIGLAAVPAFIQRSRRSDPPVLDLDLFAEKSFSRATVSAGLQQIGFFSWFFSTSFVLREIWGWSVRDTGMAISLTFVFSAVMGWVGGKAAERFGYFWPTAIGAIVAAAGPLYWYFAFESEPAFWSVYFPGAALFGLGGGVCGILTTGIALSKMSPADQGMAYAAHQTVRRMSSAAGLALMVTLLGEASGAELLGGGRNVWLLSAGVHLAMILPLLSNPRIGAKQF